MQIVAGRIITGLRCNSSRQKLYHELGWESLEYRRNKHKLTLFYKILNGLTPAYLYELVQPYLLFICPKYNNLRLVLLDSIQIIIPKNNNVDINIDLLLHGTSVDTEMCCPKGKCGCQYFILLTLKKKIHGHRGPGFCLIKN